jgi:hypothetical protein
MITSYNIFVAGNILMWPAIVTLAKLIGAKRPGWAVWGGTLVVFGLFARTFHAGIDHFAFQLVRVQNGVSVSFRKNHTLSQTFLYGEQIAELGRNPPPPLWFHSRFIRSFPIILVSSRFPL